MKNLIIWFVVLLFARSMCDVRGQLLTKRGRVIRVVDGDTFDLLHSSTVYRCRLVSVDAPERTQAFGKEATDSLKKYTLNRIVNFAFVAVDIYNRYITVITHIGGRPVKIDSIAVRNGWAWDYAERYNVPAKVSSLYQSTLSLPQNNTAAVPPVMQPNKTSQHGNMASPPPTMQLNIQTTITPQQPVTPQEQAQNDRIGIWECNRPMPPWQYRKLNAYNKRLYNQCN